jgi:hypothetical protein
MITRQNLPNLQSMKRYTAVLYLLTLVLYKPTSAQLYNRPVIRDSIYSTILQEERYLDLVVPGEYSSAEVPQATQAARTGVIYMMGEPFIASDIEHYLEIQFIPPHIIVSIGGGPKGKRNLQNGDATGGRDAFLAFITTELMPYINQKYRNNGKNILFGHSIGGLFTMYALLKSPQSFIGYILADPSFWWNHNEMQTAAREKLAGLPDTAKFLFIAGRSGEPFRSQGLAGMDSILREQARGSLHWKSVAYTDETHNSMMLRTLYDGLKFIYWGYYGSNNLVFHPDQGFVLKDKPVTIFCQNDNFSDIYYTTDGSIPTTASTPLADTIVVTAGSKLTLKAICNQPEYDKMLSGNFQESSVFPTIKLPKSAQPGGWRYDYYPLKDTADLARAKPVLSGRVDSTLKLGTLDDPEKYICMFSGFVRASQAGYYVFATQSLGALKVYLGKQLIIDLPDTDHVAIGSCIVPLSQGFYPIRVEHILKQAQQKMDLYYAVPVGSTQGKIVVPIPWQEMYSLPLKQPAK